MGKIFWLFSVDSFETSCRPMPLYRGFRSHCCIWVVNFRSIVSFLYGVSKVHLQIKQYKASARSAWRDFMLRTDLASPVPMKRQPLILSSSFPHPIQSIQECRVLSEASCDGVPSIRAVLGASKDYAESKPCRVRIMLRFPSMPE
jgi:hypothetical protein